MINLPCWVPAREIGNSRMIELDVYYFYWLSTLVTPLEGVKAEMPLPAFVMPLALARVALNGFNERPALARGYPRTADAANNLLLAINAVVPPVGSTAPDINRRLMEHEAQRIRVFGTALVAALQDEGKHGHVLKFEDQRCLSSYTLVEQIENCFPAECWQVIDDAAKKEFAEAGRCLCMERYTASGFHALRGVECVIRQYITTLTGSLPRKRDWGSYIEALKQAGADASINAVLDNIRTLERNPLMHPEDWLDIDDAVGVFNISTTAIVRLAEGIRKQQAKDAATP